MKRPFNEPFSPPKGIGPLWLNFVAAYPVGHDRHDKARIYADSGAVIRLEIGTGSVEAQVQGSQPVPYQVSIEFLPVERLKWEALWPLMTPDTLLDFRRGLISKSAIQAFAIADIALLPEPYKELKTRCNCPDQRRENQLNGVVLRSKEDMDICNLSTQQRRHGYM